MAFSAGIRQYGQDLFNLFYPETCAACGATLLRNEKILCIPCLAEMPLTGFHLDPENEVARMFWGRVPFRMASSFMLFTRGSRYRHILHELKYRGREDAGYFFGKMFGFALKDTDFATADLIHPVPLHPARFRQRGYNQSALIAEGMAETLGVPLATDLISRRVDSLTQTRRHRYERWENVRHIFRCDRPDRLVNRHVILVDDVITTGATLEACASCIAPLRGLSVSLASLAYAKLQG